MEYGWRTVKDSVVSHPERACAAGSTLHVISEREELSLWIGKNLRPSLTLLTFPIWTHSSLVFVIRFIWKSGNCESCFRPGSLWLSWLVQHSRRGGHSYDPQPTWWSFFYVIPVKCICYCMCFCKAWCQLSAVVGSGPSKDSKDPSMLTRSKSSAINWSACISRCPCSMKMVQWGNLVNQIWNISAFYDLEHLCMGSHFGTVRRFLSADVMEFFLRHTGQMHLLLYVLLQSMMSTVCSSW
jgi:hypothetical protein